MAYYSLNTEEYETALDYAKAAVISALVAEGVMTEDEGDEWSASHTVIVRKKNVFKTFLSSFWDDSKKAEGVYLLVVSLPGLPSRPITPDEPVEVPEGETGEETEEETGEETEEKAME